MWRSLVRVQVGPLTLPSDCAFYALRPYSCWFYPLPTSRRIFPFAFQLSPGSSAKRHRDLHISRFPRCAWNAGTPIRQTPNPLLSTSHSPRVIEGRLLESALHGHNAPGRETCLRFFRKKQIKAAHEYSCAAFPRRLIQRVHLNHPGTWTIINEWRQRSRRYESVVIGRRTVGEEPLRIDLRSAITATPKAFRLLFQMTEQLGRAYDFVAWPLFAFLPSFDVASGKNIECERARLAARRKWGERNDHSGQDGYQRKRR